MANQLDVRNVKANVNEILGVVSGSLTLVLYTPLGVYQRKFEFDGASLAEFFIWVTELIGAQAAILELEPPTWAGRLQLKTEAP